MSQQVDTEVFNNISRQLAIDMAEDVLSVYNDVREYSPDLITSILAFTSYESGYCGVPVAHTLKALLYHPALMLRLQKAGLRMCVPTPSVN